MRTRVALAAVGVGLLFAGVAIDRYLLPRPAVAVPSAPSAPPSRFLASFDGLNAVERHLNGVEPALISELVGGEVRVDQGVYTKSYHCHYSYPNPGGYAEIKSAMRAIANDIAAQVAAGGGTTICKGLGWGVEPAEWVYEVDGRRGVVTILVLELNQPAPTDLQANLAVLVQVTEF
jgi:hypothetical protein